MKVVLISGRFIARENLFLPIAAHWQFFALLPEKNQNRFQKYRADHLASRESLAVLPFSVLFDDPTLTTAIDSSMLEWPRAYREYFSGEDWFVVAREKDFPTFQDGFVEMLSVVIVYTNENCQRFETMDRFALFEAINGEQRRATLSECALAHVVQSSRTPTLLAFGFEVRDAPRYAPQFPIQYAPPPVFMIRSNEGAEHQLLKSGTIPEKTRFFSSPLFYRPPPSCEDADPTDVYCQYSSLFYALKRSPLQSAVNLLRTSSRLFDLAEGHYPLPNDVMIAMHGFHENRWYNVAGVSSAYLFMFGGPLLAIAIFSALIAAILQPLLSSYLSGLIKGQAFGNDGYGERVVGVGSPLAPLGREPNSLPDAVEQDMTANSLNEAPAAIQRLRGSVGQR